MAIQSVEQTQRKTYTAEDVWELSLRDEHYELINGELILMSPGKQTHGRLIAWLAIVLGNHIISNKLGAIYGAETGYTMPNGDVIAPDVSFTVQARIPANDDQPGFTTVAPDLAVEVMSASNTRIEMQQKVDLFFSAGTRQVWVFYPKSKTVYVYTAPDKVVILRGDAIIEGGDVLPGFALKVSDVYGILES